MKEEIGKRLDRIKSLCLDYEYSQRLSADISELLLEVIHRINWMTMADRMSGVYLTKEQYDQLLEFKYRYEDLCK